MKLTRQFTFEAGHHLPNYVGKCNQTHGHSYKLFISISGDVDEKTGMVIDFGDMDRVVRETVLNKLDHAYLNHIMPNPTAENTCRLIFKILLTAFGTLDVILGEVLLYETANSSCSYTYRDFQLDGGV